jgi:hypothetical protein
MTKAGDQDAPDLYRMVELFRDHRRHLAVEKGHASQSAFTTTFQGQPPQGQPPQGQPPQGQPPQEGNRNKKDCLCGEPHRFKEYPYLIEGKRPTG